MRNERYRKNAISVRERHNERKNEVYSNPDVLLEYSRNNVTFKPCEAATYAQQFDRMVEEGVVSTRGLKPDAYVFDELVFDVNTDYFESHGGYEYAKQFYAEVYELAKEIAGGEQYIISAVMHADERNREASDRLGRNVFHYHLHVVYLPVVEKQIRWSKRCKDPALRGTVRETIMQVSHSKKWPMVPMTDEQGQPVLKKNGKPRLVSSYSLLQTQFFEHMRQAGFTDFERGVQGSDAEHLEVLEYKVQKDRQTVAELSDQTKQLQGQRKELISQVKNISGSIRDVLLFPQGFTALMTQPDLLADEPSMLLLDIGGWTVDLMRIDNGRPIIDTCHSLEFGMIRCIDEVRERVRQNTGLSLTDAQIEQVLAGRPCSLEESVRSLIREQGRLYTERLLSAVLEAGFDYHALPVVMMGGGASVVSRHVHPTDAICRTVTLLDDRVNAQGYERAVAALWGDDAQG